MSYTVPMKLYIQLESVTEVIVTFGYHAFSLSEIQKVIKSPEDLLWTRYTDVSKLNILRYLIFTKSIRQVYILLHRLGNQDNEGSSKS